MWTERGSAGTPFERTGFKRGATKPSVAELMIRRRFPHLLRMRRQRFVSFSLVQLLSVHISMGSHGTAFNRSVHAKGQMPRVNVLLGVHGNRAISFQTSANAKHSTQSYQLQWSRLNQQSNPTSRVRQAVVGHLSSGGGRWPEKVIPRGWRGHRPLSPRRKREVVANRTEVQCKSTKQLQRNALDLTTTR